MAVFQGHYNTDDDDDDVFTELVCVLHQRLRNMDASRYCVVTLIALLIEAFLSPVWLNSNGLCFDFPPRTRQENPNNTHTHTPASYLGKGSMQGKGEGHHHDQTSSHNETDREMITWLMSFKRGHEADRCCIYKADIDI